MRTIFPMGCKKTPEVGKVEQLLADPHYVAQPKIDGVRCILHFDDDGTARYTTRGASLNDPETPLEITHRLSHMQARVPKLAGLELDGEIWRLGLTSAEISGQISYKSTVPVDKSLKLHVFDILHTLKASTESLSLYQREVLLNRFDAALSYLPFIERVPTVCTEEDKRELLAQELEGGKRRYSPQESYVQTISLVPYQRDSKPANHWYKVKKKDTIDVIITGSNPPNTSTGTPLLEPMT